jgi:hypothetical protein
MPRHTKKQRGAGYGMGPQVAPGMVSNYAQEIVSTGKPLCPDCLAAQKTDTMGFSGPKGLPGLSGGRRDTRRNGNLIQYGGRYGFDLSATVAPSAGPALGGIPPVQKIACESSSTTANPLNKVQSGGVGGVDSAAYYAPTAGYANQAATFKDSVGGSVMIQLPYEARAMNPACLKTGGGRRGRAHTRGRKQRGGAEMKISSVIQKLQKIKEKKGDIPVYLSKYEGGESYLENIRDIDYSNKGGNTVVLIE